MGTLVTIIAFIVAVGLLVTVHELGHYWVARWSNVKILRFSVGFGRPLWMTRRGPDQTEWVLAAIPLGGYVRMLDERDADARTEDLPRSFNRQNVWKRIAIVLAGPAANFLLAGVLYWALFVQGTPALKPFVAAPAPSTAAAQAGLSDFDLIRSVNGQPVATWQDVRWHLLQEVVRSGEVLLEVEDVAGKVSQRALPMKDVSKNDLEKDFLPKLGLIDPRFANIVGGVVKGRPAQLAGLRSGDRIVSIGGKQIGTWFDITAALSKAPPAGVEIEFQRGGEIRRVFVVPENVTDEKGNKRMRIGIEQRDDDRLYTTVRHGPVEALGKSAVKVWDMSIFSLKMLGKMVTGDISWRNLSGPITIADYAGQTAKLGILPYLTFLALVSVSIGVLNLLPIPVLDGGQLVYYLVEIFKGSPVSQRVVEMGQQIGLALLLGLTAFAFYNDIHRLITS
jgi:regulator of sigma E protease